MQQFDYIFKLLIIGESGVGKSCILVRFVEDEYDEDTPCTIGVDFKIKILENFHGKKINLTIWDTAGQEKFRSLTSSYYRGTHGIILVFDVTNRESFTNLNMWLEEVELYSNTKVSPIKLLIGNKIDRSDRAVTKEEATAYARSKGMVYIETSAKTRVGIQQAFEEIVQKILDTCSVSNNNANSRGVSLNENNNNPQASDSSCYC